MAEQRRLGGKDRSEGTAVPGESRVPDGVDTAVDAVQAPGRRPVVDRASWETEGFS
jgi:hypothetical protein